MTRSSAACLWILALCACGEQPRDPAAMAPFEGAPASNGAGSPAAPAADGGMTQSLLPQVRIASGELVGRTVPGDVQAFLGIPYAKPPIGPLRWRPPEAPEPWSTPLDAARLSLPCPQAAWAGAPDAAESEDCLYLNVWAPRAHASSPRAVMVWIHGGGNTNGSASEPGYDGRLFAERHGIVLVSLNYRLGVFGFFAHDGLVAESTPPGNQGLRDQRLALQWVRTNIAAFGGDPTNVTIFGESAGSLDVCLHVAAPGSRGLFHRAISQSGGCTTRRPTLAEASARAPAFASLAGCPPEPASVDTRVGADTALPCLRAKGHSELMRAASNAAGSGIVFAPVVDGDFVPEQPRALFDRGDIARVPYLLGSTNDEGTFLVGDQTQLESEQEYLAALVQRYGAQDAPSIAAHYPSSAFAAEPNPYYAAIARAVGDQRLVCSTFDVALRALANDVPVYLYNFDIAVDGPDGPLGAAHAAELAYVFGTSPAFTPEQRAVSERMQAYWANFARAADPNGPELHAWPALGERANLRLNFALESTVVPDFRATECAFWRAHYDRAFTSAP